MLAGLPGSGKSTYARECMNSGEVMRVNRDDIRQMLFKTWKGVKEQVVTQVEIATIRAAVDNGFDIIIDDTNLSTSSRSRWQNLSLELGVPLVEKSIPAPIEECIQRDAKRIGNNHVGRGVIENMALRYNLIPPVPADQKVVIFDVDGTLADNGDRVKYLNLCKACGLFDTNPIHGVGGHTFIPGKKDHATYFSRANEDTPIASVIEWCQRCHYGGYYVLIVSGRPTDLGGDITVEWLRRNGVVYQHIFMRAGGDYRDDTIIKTEILNQICQWIPKEQILFAVDDRPRVINGVWRANGITCYDVGHGINF